MTELRLPDEPESLWNYEICGEKTLAGTPCRARRDRDHRTGESIPCPLHVSDERKAFNAARAERLRENSVPYSRPECPTYWEKDWTTKEWTELHCREGSFHRGGGQQPHSFRTNDRTYLWTNQDAKWSAEKHDQDKVPAAVQRRIAFEDYIKATEKRIEKTLKDFAMYSEQLVEYKAALRENAGSEILEDGSSLALTKARAGTNDAVAGIERTQKEYWYEVGYLIGSEKLTAAEARTKALEVEYA